MDCYFRAYCHRFRKVVPLELVVAMVVVVEALEQEVASYHRSSLLQDP
jgi:hypothetical protein